MGVCVGLMQNSWQTYPLASADKSNSPFFFPSQKKKSSDANFWPPSSQSYWVKTSFCPWCAKTLEIVTFSS